MTQDGGVSGRAPDSDLPRRLGRIVDDVLVERDLHGLPPRLARDLQLAASAITHERFRVLMAALAERLERDGS